MDVFAPEKEEQHEDLRLSLTHISQKAISSDLNDLSQVLELAHVFEKWTHRARSAYGPWIEDYRIQAQQLVSDLQAGRPVPKCMENLLRSLLQLHRALDKAREQQQAAEESPEAPAPAPLPAPPPAAAPLDLLPEPAVPFSPTSLIAPPPPPPAEDPAPKNNDALEAGRKYHEFLQRTFENKVNHMENLLEALGELTLCQAQLAEDLHASALSESTGLNSEAVRMEKLTRQIRDLVLALRLVPVQALFEKVSEEARRLSKTMRKNVQVTAEGEDTEIDQRLIEDLEILMGHLLRNTLEHGLESAAERQAAGKNPEGVFRMKASHLGGAFVLEVEDDGRGILLSRIRSRAQELGWLKPGEEPAPAALIDFLFKPGFAPLHAQGRVAGLEDMEQRVQRLKGSIRVQSQEGEGCRMILRLPKTLALIEGVLVRVGRKRYLLPMTQVRKISLTGVQEYEEGPGGAKWLRTPDGDYPLVDLNQWFGEPESGRGRVSLQVEAGRTRMCLLADEVMGKQQVMMKGLGDALQSMPGISGGAILGDGKVGLILDVNALTQPSWNIL
ncbi:MAG TPA: chemotaxis protein CheW [bacterium]|nr:chemotaxis protein CheW [bacterium]